ncbi:Transcription factor iws1 [Thalictrum thalictroides]|uniref:Transcription factor iws1 n=1 Tax=Thalictrum thalictroides TaxID=46969 RepID=A0A7J6X6E6_THATH|nr:Transcription factor iws1 [Thalictrum thalictroides]
MVMKESNNNKKAMSPTMEVVSMQKGEEKVEEKDEIEELFKNISYRKRKRRDGQKTSADVAAEISMYVEGVIAMLEVATEEDAQLNRQCKPAVNKLKNLPLLTEVLLKKHLQEEFLDHDVLGLLKSWLEPLPDGSLPNVSVRTAILEILSDYPIDVGQYNRREQLKKSGIGKVIMFLSKTDEEIVPNRKLARALVDKWSRPLYNKSTRFDQEMRSSSMIHDEKPLSKKPASTKVLVLKDNDIDLSAKKETGKPSSRREYVTKPEALALDFTVRPLSKINLDMIRERSKNAMQDDVRSRLNKKMKSQTKSRKTTLQAAKLSAEGRNMLMIY